MDYPEAVQFIDSFINYEKTVSWEYPEAFKLDRMRALAREFGNPQNAYESVIIAGSTFGAAYALCQSAKNASVNTTSRIFCEFFIRVVPRITEAELRQLNRKLSDYFRCCSTPAYKSSASRC